MTYGDCIKKARKNAGLTQAELANKCGIGTRTIQQYESNSRQPNLLRFGKIAKALNTTVYELIGDDWSGIDINGAFAPEAEAKKEPAPIAGSGSNWDRLLSIFNQLSPEDQAELVSVAEKFAKASQHK